MKKKEGKSLTRSGLETLYLELEKPMYNVVYRWLWDSEESQDVVQEAFLHLWNMRSWKWVPFKVLSGAKAGNPDAASRMAADREIRNIRTAVEKLPEKLKRVIMLCDLGEMSYEETGKTLGISPGTVGSRRNKAMKILKEDLVRLIKEEHDGI